jgi:hypothetical protein
MKKAILVFFIGVFLFFDYFLCFAQDPGAPDTVWFENADYYLDGPPYSGKLKVTLSFFNDEELMGISVPLVWTGPVQLDSGSFSESRAPESQYRNIDIDSVNQKALIAVIIMTGDIIYPGRGSLIDLYFTISDTGYLEIDTFISETYDRLGFFPSEAMTIYPQFRKFQSHLLITSVAGDANQDGFADVSDIVFLVNYLFKGGSPTYCHRCADVNGD